MPFNPNSEDPLILAKSGCGAVENGFTELDYLSSAYQSHVCPKAEKRTKGLVANFVNEYLPTLVSISFLPRPNMSCSVSTPPP